MSDPARDKDVPVGVALLLGAYLVAQEVANHERPGETQLRMEAALGFLAEDLRKEAPEYFVIGQMPELSALADGWAPDEGVLLLVELQTADPFYPYQFEMGTKSRPDERRAALREISRGALRLPAGTADQVGAAWEQVRDAEAKALRRKNLFNPKTLATAVGAGAALAGAAVVAAPAIAVLMPAAAGLTGAAAVSAGLAQLGFGSIAAGGMGMVGGMWVLGTSGAVAGAASATTASLLATPGSAPLLGAEVRKLLVSFVLANDDVLDRPADDFARGLDTMLDEIHVTIELEEARNEKGSARLTELDELKRAVEFGGQFMTEQTKAAHP